MKNIRVVLQLCAVAFLAVAAQAQYSRSYILYSAGAPAGNCPSVTYLDVDTVTPNLYYCPVPGAAWVKATAAAVAVPISAANGGTGIDTSASTGVAQVASGTWTVSTTLPSGLSATNLTLVTPALGTPASGVITNLTGTCSNCNANNSAQVNTNTYPAAAGFTSGGIPFFSSTTAEGSSALLTSHVLIQGGGSGAAPTVGNGDFTVDSTAHTLLSGASGLVDFSAITGATGFKVPVQAGATAGAAGVIVYDSTAKSTKCASNDVDAQCITSTTAPAANTLWKSANASRATGQGSSITDNGTVITSAAQLKIGTAGGSTAIIDVSAGSTTAAMSVQSSATCTNITGMTWTIAANKNYILRCQIPRTLAATATLQYCLGGPGTATSYSLDVQGANGASGVWSDLNILAQTAYGGKTTASAAAANTSVDYIYAFIQNGATASGTALTLQTAANGTNNITVLANASCTLTGEN